jgi:hypothetical protein
MCIKTQLSIIFILASVTQMSDVANGPLEKKGYSSRGLGRKITILRYFKKYFKQNYFHNVNISNEFLFFEVHSLINQTASTIKFS